MLRNVKPLPALLLLGFLITNLCDIWFPTAFSFLKVKFFNLLSSKHLSTVKVEIIQQWCFSKMLLNSTSGDECSSYWPCVKVAF